MTDAETLAQLLDETKPALDALKRTIRPARIIATHIDRPTSRYDHGLAAISEIESEFNYLVRDHAEHMAEEESV